MNKRAEEPIRILHVEDDSEFAEMTKEFLEAEAKMFEVRTETSPSEALEVVAAEDIDCIVSDYNMPEATGIELLEDIRVDYPELPFILYTGRGSEEIASEAISKGVTDYLQKDLGADQYTVLANRIENAVGQYRAQQQLEETTTFYSTILDHSSDYVMIVDEIGMVSYISPAIERVMGYTPEDVMAMEAFEFVHPEDLEAATSTLQKIIEFPEQEHTVEFRAQHSKGTWRWLEVRGRNLFDDPVINGIMVNVRDITERKRREQDLEEQKERLENLTTYLSHDVRNQLSIVTGNIELVQSDSESERLETAYNALMRIEDMIEKIMELSRSGKLSSEPTPVDVESLIDDCRRNIGNDEVTLRAEAELVIRADRDRLHSLFENLILNAIDHGDAGTITVGSLSNGAGFFVADDGVGIPLEERDRIFDSDYTTSDESTGFGLTIVKEIADTHGWEVNVTESEEGGARFEFTNVSLAS